MKKLVALGCLGVLVLVVIIGVVVIAGSYNGMVTSSQNVNAAWAKVESQYQRRSDLIPNIVATVQAGANFEKSTLTAVVEARAKATSVTIDPSKAPDDAAKLQEYQAAQQQVGGALSRLLVSVEAYPNLKTNTQFLGLQDELAGTENRIAVARNDFNAAVQDYDTSIQSFPRVLIAGMFGFHTKPYFEADAAASVAPNVGSMFNPNGGAPASAPAAFH
jgi:LemA protein